MKRITIVVLISFGCLVSVASGQQPPGTCRNIWAQFHKYNMSRLNPCEKVLSVNNVGSLALKWSYATGDYVGSSPTVANGAVYVSSYDGMVYALNPGTGGYVESSAAVAYGTSARAMAKYMR